MKPTWLAVASRARQLHATALLHNKKANAARATAFPAPLYDVASALSEPLAVLSNARDRNVNLTKADIDSLIADETQSIALRKEIDQLRHARNVASDRQSKPTPEQAKQASHVKSQLKDLETRLRELQHRVEAVADRIPNWSHPHAPVGDESKARIIKTFGPAIPPDAAVAKPSRDHLALSDSMDEPWFDMASAALTTGASWPLLLNEAVSLELALTHYAMHKASSPPHNFTPTIVPDVVKTDLAHRCGFQPRDPVGGAQQTYFVHTADPAATDHLCLAGTAEVPLVGMSAGKTFDGARLPLKHVALGRAFRAEAGARGQDSRGLYRVHQFTKVEMVVVCDPDESDESLGRLLDVQLDILRPLGLSLRVLDMPTHELGAAAHRKYDIECWMPGRGKWGELSSASNCTDFQARRLGIRCRPSSRKALEDIDLPIPAALEATALYPSRFGSSKKTTFAHTLNGTAAAIPRLIVALLENGAVLGGTGKGGQRLERVRLPGVLRPFWIGKQDRIEWVPDGRPLRL